MYELNDMEQQWRRYKRRKLKPYAIIAGICIGVGTLSAFTTYAFMSRAISKQTSDMNISLNTSAPRPVQPIIQPIEPPLLNQSAQGATSAVPNQKEIVIVSPEQNDDARMREIIAKRSDAEQQASLPAQVYLPKQSANQLVQTPIKQTIQAKTPPPKIYIETKNANQSELLAARYKEHPDTQTAIELYRIFYRAGNYKEALTWAMNANQLDSNNELSWLAFAKASYKLGRKQDAQTALENFIRVSGSQNAKTLLAQIKNNTL